MKTFTDCCREVAEKYGYNHSNDPFQKMIIMTDSKVLEQAAELYAERRVEEATRWIPVSERMPEALKTVWLTNVKGWACLGCLVETEDGWHWAQSNGVIYVEKNEIVSECESDDLDVTHWMPIPELPKTTQP